MDMVNAYNGFTGSSNPAGGDNNVRRSQRDDSIERKAPQRSEKHVGIVSNKLNAKMMMLAEFAKEF
jgi:hypothetical protein